MRRLPAFHDTAASEVGRGAYVLVTSASIMSSFSALHGFSPDAIALLGMSTQLAVWAMIAKRSVTPR